MATANQEIKELREDIKHLAETVEKNAKSISNGHTNVLGFDTEHLKDAAHQAGKNFNTYLHDKSRQAVELRDECQKTIRTNPLKSVALAAASGLLIGALLNRR